MYYINYPEPISLEYLAGGIVAEGFNCDICKDEWDYYLIVSHQSSQEKLCLISAYTCDVERVTQLCQKMRKLDFWVVLGGYHPSSVVDLSQDCCDFVVKGEGEEVSVLLAKAILLNETVILNGKHCNKNNLPSIIHSNLIDDLNKLPFPLRAPSRLNRYVQTDLGWPPVSQRHNATVALFSRGCRYGCEFCASQVMWGSNVRFRTVENIIAELRYLKNEFDTNYVVTLDQNFGQNREWTIDVCRAIAEADLGISLYHLSHLNIDLDLLELFAKAGCKKIGFGLELLSSNLVGTVKSSNPTDLESVNKTLDVCTSNGIFTKAYVMIGFPWEDEDVIAGYMEDVQKIRATEIKIMYITPFPGTVYWDKYKDQLVTTEWKYFDTVSMPVIHNSNISVSRYHKIRMELFRNFYGSQVYAETTSKLVKNFPHYAQSFREFFPYLKSNDMITGQEQWLEWIGLSRAKESAKEDVTCRYL